MKSGPSRVTPLRAASGRLTLLVLLVVICRQSIAQEASAAESQNLTIHGVVINSVTREPVSRALVSSADSRLATFTDDQGRFEFAIPQPVPNAATNPADQETVLGLARVSAGFVFSSMLTARKPGFLNPQNSVSNLPVDPTGPDLTLILVPEALIVGRVVLPNSNSADRIQVNLYRRQVAEGRGQWLDAGSVTARSNGDFRFSDLVAGTYKLFTGEQMDRDPLTFDPGGPFYGFPPAYFPNATDFESGATIQLTAGMTFQAELSPVRQPYYSIKVPVTNAPADMGLMIEVTVQGRRGPGFGLGYNNQDQKIEGSLPNGTYVIEVTSMGPTFAHGSATLTVKGANVEGSPLTLAPMASVRVRARQDFKEDPASEPNQAEPAHSDSEQSPWQRLNLNVRLEPAGEFQQANLSPQMRPPSGPHDDSLIYDNVAPGRYWVLVTSGRGFPSSVTAGNLDLLRHPLTIGPGANLAVDVTLRDDGAELTGSIEGLGNEIASTDNETRALPNSFVLRNTGQIRAYIYCVPVPDSTGQFRDFQVSSEGKFALQQLPPGAYRVLAFDRPQQNLEYRNAEAMRAYETKGQVVRLAAGQKETVRLQLITSNE